MANAAGASVSQASHDVPLILAQVENRGDQNSRGLRLVKNAVCAVPVRQRCNPYQPGATPQEFAGKKSKRAESPSHCGVVARDGSSFQPSGALGSVSQGVTLGWYGCGPLALHEFRYSL